MKFAMAMRQFFGFKQGETLSQFVQELKALTPEDKAELCEMLSEELGVEVTQ